ncbi:MAG: ABC transporter substrate-binding protein [Bauldia sp.]|nr:ABC transporter substrate-binding protein [Bauldia sp.]
MSNDTRTIRPFLPLTRRGFMAGTAAAGLLAATGVRAQGATRSITHKFGATEVPADPQRVVSVGWDEHDMMLTFGVVSVLQRDAWGEQPYGTWPWAIPALGGAQPETFSDDMPFERILAMEPDLIMGTWAGIDEDTWRRLSAIAPTVAGHPGYDDWATPWDERVRFIGAVFGQEEKAEAEIAAIAQRIADIRDAHPEWQALEAVSVTVDDTNFYVAAEGHSRGKLLLDLGFILPDEIAAVAVDGNAAIARENVAILDRDLVIWVNGQDDSSNIVNIPLRTRLAAHAEGREVYCDKVLTAAFSIQSPLSYNFLLDTLIPEIERAVDGDPATPVEAAVAYGIAG